MTVWIAYHFDWSGFALFATEVEALRHAVDRSMSVGELTLPCPDPKTQLERVRNASAQKRLSEAFQKPPSITASIRNV